MEELERPVIRCRVKGRGAILRRLGGLIVAVNRYGMCRASTIEDRRWSAHLLTELELTLKAARDGRLEQRDGGRRDAALNPNRHERPVSLAVAGTSDVTADVPVRDRQVAKGLRAAPRTIVVPGRFCELARRYVSTGEADSLVSSN